MKSRTPIAVGIAALIACVGLGFTTGVSAAPQAARGDANNDGSITLADAIYVTRYLFARGLAPVPTLDSGDANCDGRIDSLDAVAIINFVMRAGKRPGCPSD